MLGSYCWSQGIRFKGKVTRYFFEIIGDQKNFYPNWNFTSVNWHFKNRTISANRGQIDPFRGQISKSGQSFEKQVYGQPI